MAPKKGQWRSKVKEPALKAPPKRTLVVLSFLNKEDVEADQQANLAHLAALEEAQGLSPGSSGMQWHDQEQLG